MAKIGWIGLGNMGTPMSTNLVNAGNEVLVWNRTKSKADEVIAAGAKWADSPKEIAEKCDFIFTMIADGKTLKSVCLDDNGVVAGLTPGKIVIDMSTVAPSESLAVNEAVEAKGCKLLRSPVTGSVIPAKNGALGILSSGDKAAYEKVLPLFECLGKNKFYLGGAEEARVLKLAVNTMVGNTTQLLAEAVVLAEKAGLNVPQVMEVIAGSAVGSIVVNSKVAPITSGDYAPAFNVKLMCKDLDLAVETAKEIGVALPVTTLTRQFYQMAINTGRAEKDYSVLCQILEEQCGIKR